MKFKPEDFIHSLRADEPRPKYDAEMCAELANAKLEEWLKTAPTVYLNDEQLIGTDATVGNKYFDDRYHTHTGKLVAIEEITGG